AATLPADSSARRAVDYLVNILSQLGCTEITAKVAEKDNGAFIVLDGEGLGAVIGHRGETLDALQYLAGLAANNNGGYYKVSLNIGNYREKREQTLISLANRVAEQVLRTGRNRSLEPMNPYERRIIHTAIQEIDGVVSASFGEGANRRVIVAPEGAEIRPPRRDGRDNRRGGRGGRGGRDRRPSNKVEVTPTREPKKDADLPLYGKIN
ncbi:MAG: KH domain-containing protein, partial [Clostridia bacterium]|nr:KH domain-containing protein [Clostridia bacterium]